MIAAYSLTRMVRSIGNDLQIRGRVRFVSCLSPCLVILSVLLMLFSTSAISTIYTADLQRAIAQITTPTTTKPSSSNSFLTYENNSTLGIKIQYPANWQRIESEDNDHGVLFLSPSESSSDRFLESFSVSSSSFLTLIIIIM